MNLAKMRHQQERATGIWCMSARCPACDRSPAEFNTCSVLVHDLDLDKWVRCADA